MEPLLSNTKNRYVLFPIEYHDIYKKYQQSVSVFWVPNEVDLTKQDLSDWDTRLSDDERYFVKNVLAFFASSDSIVIENLAGRFLNEVQIPEAKAFYGFQIAIETIHQEMYSMMIDTYVKDNAEKSKLFDAIFTVPSIQKKANWALAYITSQESFATRLIAFAIVEGIFFSSAFASIFWLKERNLMPGLCQSNEFISRDEGLHTEFAVLLYTKYIENKLPEAEVHKIIKEATELECDFVINSLKVPLIGMNCDLMTEYVYFCADRLTKQLGYSAIFNTKNPFPFMERIGLTNKTNFFEHYVSDYSKANVGNKQAFEFSTDADF